MYVCGPTVYNFAHIGNARPPVIFDVLAKLLRRRYPQVIYARNITDVEDKINLAASQAGVSIETIAQRYTKAYQDDMHALGVSNPDVQPRATEHMPQMIHMIATLIDRGHAYAAQGHVLFDVSSFPDYGALSGRSPDEMIAGARVEIAPYKKTPADFVLWKPSNPDQPGWESPWGRGRPGWHIECSAMSEAHLGETIDIHAGGNDLLFPHHENEVAQSTCAHGGKLFARYWLHNGFVTVEGRKMSKSLGNVLLIHDLRQKAPPEALRYVLLKAHYRQPLDWSESALAQAASTLNGLYGVLRDLAGVAAQAEVALPDAFETALCDDLNTPEALAILSRLADTARKAPTVAAKSEAKSALLSAGAFLGLLQQDPEVWFKQSAAGQKPIDATHVEQLIAARIAARNAKDFAKADAIRDELRDLGVVIEDGSGGTRWRTANA